jgi:nucleoside-diphosphate-sugar epimerase
MQVAITGASGFLGRELSSRLRASGHEVSALSRRAGPGLDFVQDYARDVHAEVIVHLAETSDRRAANAAGDNYERQALATLRALLGSGARRFVYASSAALYGDESARARRTDDPVLATDTYSRLKLASEGLVLSAPGVEGVVARITNLYGAGMSDANVVSRILAQIPGHGPVQVLDDGPVRDFLWVGDAARALQAMVEGRAGGVFNVGSGGGTSVRDLALLALRAAGQPDRGVEALQPSSRPSTLVLDPTLTRRTFDWQPETSLSLGLDRLVGLNMVQHHD